MKKRTKTKLKRNGGPKARMFRMVEKTRVWVTTGDHSMRMS